MAYSKIIVGVDESPSGADALRAGAQIAAASEAELEALRVVRNPWRLITPSEVATARPVHERSFAELAATRECAEVQCLLDTLTIGSTRARPAIRFGIPAIEVPRWTELEGADLLVVGHQPVGPLERRPAGRTLEGILRRAAVPTLVVPFGQRTWKRVLVLADPPIAAGDVLAAGLAFAEPFDSEVIVLDVDSEPLTAVAGRTEVIARKAFALWSRRSRGGGLDVATSRGDLAGEALKVAHEAKADVLVVGRRRGESVAEAGVLSRILQRAPCAVLVVPI
jgi:nucleotide-binding universal stress UspA family protein